MNEISQNPWDLFSHHSIPCSLKIQARKTPDAIALNAPGSSPITYKRLYNQIKTIVANLNALGLSRHDRIAVVLPNGIEMAVAFLAVASGATCAPLNPNYRAAEFEFYLADLRAKALIVQSGMPSPARKIAKERGIPIIELSRVLEGSAEIFTLDGGEPKHIEQGGFAQPEDIALILHTSGTTSRPKMVPLTHANLCTSAHNIRTALNLVNSDRCLNVMPLFHIHGLMGALLSSLCSGASVVCTPGFNAPRFFPWLDEFRPTWYSAVPTMHQGILARAGTNQDIIARCPIRLIRSSSAPLPPQIMVELEKAFNAPVIESYGMTEASHQMASNPLPPKVRKPGSVGMAAGPEIAIMDESGKLLPPEEIGEVVIQGANVTIGYENNSQANQNAFTNGWFRTGDLGYLDADGYLFLQGRIKEIINRGGEKISPREVDEVLLDHQAVEQVVTFAAPHALLGEEVASAIVLRDRASATEQEIKEFVAARLADFKVPRVVLFVDEIPKGPTGKRQRIGLAEKLGLTASAFTKAPVAEYASPRTKIEEKLVRIWSEVLGVEQVGIYDDFFQLGGDSLLAANMVNYIREAMDFELSFLIFFQQPTVAKMAAKIAQTQSEKLVADILTELESLSEEEAQRLLQQM